jgi:cephalosporin hydroxylase
MPEKPVSSPASSSFYENIFPNEWMMSNWEKHTFISVLQALKPEAAIEIGNAKGGSLQVLNKLVPNVYAIDIEPEIHQNLKPQFPDVNFLTGSSLEILPELLKKIRSQGIKLGFILIDSDHTTEGVRADINTILKNYTPVCRLVILLHDSFNPHCRKGILTADWKENPYVHLVDTDYIPGTYIDDIYNNHIQKKSMWGGFALAVLEPYPRKSDLIIRQSVERLYRQTYKGSFYSTFYYRIRKLYHSIKKMLSKQQHKV